MIRFFSITIILFFFPISESIAQEFNNYSFNNLYGFEIETIYDIHEDASGIFWLGTNEGLVKFNGVNFTYLTLDGYGKSCTNIAEDVTGRIWYSNFGGQLFCVNKDKIEVIVEECKGLGYIQDFKIKNESVFFVTTNGKFFRKDLRTKKTRTIKSFENKVISKSLPEENKFIFSVENRNQKQDQFELNIWSYNLTSGKSKIIGSTDLSIKSAKINICSEANSVYYWRASSNLEVFEIKDGQIKKLFTNLQIQHIDINAIDVNQGVFEVKTKSGIYWIDKSGNIVGSQKSLDLYSVSKTYTDHENNWWICTLNDGVRIVPNKQIKNRRLCDIEIAKSCQDENGVIYFIDINGYFYKASPPFNEVILIGQKDMTNGGAIKYDSITERIYFSFSDYFYDIPSNSFKKLSKYGIDQLGFRDLVFIGKDDVLSCSFSVTNLINIKADPLSELASSYEGELVYPYYNRIRHENSYHAEKGEGSKNIYISYKDGIYMYGPNVTKKIQISGKRIIATSIVTANKKGVWVTTSDKRLLKIVNGLVINSYDLPEIGTKLIEWNDVIFISSKKSIYRLDNKSGALNLIDASDGLLQERIVDLYIRGNTLIVIGKEFVQKIPCSYEKTNSIPPKMRIESVLLFEDEIHRNSYDFEYDENNITINFSATSIRSQGNCAYQYRLNGGDWTKTDFNAAYARFPKLAPGSYEFEVRAINEDGIKSSIQKLSFTIDQHYTQKWWFISLVVLSIGLFIFFLVRNRLSHLKAHSQLEIKQQQLKKEMYKSKIAALRAQMNPHFMFNALNTIQEFIVTNQKGIASEYLADFADLMRKYLEQSKKEEIVLSEEIETLEIYLNLENLRSDGELNYTIQHEPTLNTYEVSLPVMLLQPFIENSIKHGLLHSSGEKRLLISFSRISENRISCVIEDNGIGRTASGIINNARAGNHVSFASKAMDQKLELVNKVSSRNMTIVFEDLFENDTPAGTRVTVQLDI